MIALRRLSLLCARAAATKPNRLTTPLITRTVAPLITRPLLTPSIRAYSTTQPSNEPTTQQPTTDTLESATKDAGRAFFEQKDYSKAVSLLKALLSRPDFTNDSIGIIRMVAVMFANGGKECDQDVSKAIELFESLVEKQSDPFALFGLGLLHVKGRGVAQDFLRAARYFQKAADAGNVQAHYYLGVLSELGIGVSKDEAKALEYYTVAAEKGDANACTNLGIYYRKRGESSKSMDLFKRAARENELAFFTLSAMTDRGEGVDPTYKPNRGFLDLMWITGASPDVHLQAILVENGAPLDFGLDLFDFAKAEGPVKDKYAFQFVTLLYNAGEGSLFARFLAGMRYEFGLVESFGHGMLMDTYKAQHKPEQGEFKEPSYNRIALDMYLSAADQEFVVAQRKLGVVFAKGLLGVTADPTKAFKVFEELAAKNDPIAQYNLGVLYLNGLGVEKDLVKASEQFQLASKQGLSDAEYNLALLYEQGEGGVKKDVARAKQLFTNAAKRGLLDAIERIKGQ
ncbi:hypothetical protein HDU79_005715 [Rhizoclosmatium sp. JEL0117]|nr:hypothetical protein HDU79_005715 [Rhizoclosmatium sp. JEL0117]